MRRKIAKRRRRDILALGGVIEKEEWCDAKAMACKENVYLVQVQHDGCRTMSAGKDELEAYQTAILSMKYPLGPVLADIYEVRSK